MLIFLVCLNPYQDEHKHCGDGFFVEYECDWQPQYDYLPFLNDADLKVSTLDKANKSSNDDLASNFVAPTKGNLPGSDKGSHNGSGSGSDEDGQANGSDLAAAGGEEKGGSMNPLPWRLFSTKALSFTLPFPLPLLVSSIASKQS